MSIDEERKNQESEPIAARANTQPRRRGPMGRGGMCLAKRREISRAPC